MEQSRCSLLVFSPFTAGLFLLAAVVCLWVTAAHFRPKWQLIHFSGNMALWRRVGQGRIRFQSGLSQPLRYVRNCPFPKQLNWSDGLKLAQAQRERYGTGRAVCSHRSDRLWMDEKLRFDFLDQIDFFDYSFSDYNSHLIFFFFSLLVLST